MSYLYRFFDFARPAHSTQNDIICCKLDVSHSYHLGLKFLGTLWKGITHISSLNMNTTNSRLCYSERQITMNDDLVLCSLNKDNDKKTH